MRALLVFISLLVWPTGASSGQPSESTLKSLYGEPLNGSFEIRSDVHLKAAFTPDHRACALAISGAATEQDLPGIFDAIVPKPARGIKVFDLVQCAGGCVRFMQFAEVEFSLAKAGTSQTSEPAAIITFKSKECEPVIKKANLVLFFKQRHH